MIRGVEEGGGGARKGPGSWGGGERTEGSGTHRRARLRTWRLRNNPGRRRRGTCRLGLEHQGLDPLVVQMLVLQLRVFHDDGGKGEDEEALEDQLGDSQPRPVAFHGVVGVAEECEDLDC
eukprot:766640-Hanusia_phi.AAC.2